MVNVIHMGRILRAFNLELGVKFWLEFGTFLYRVVYIHIKVILPSNNLSMLRVSSFEMILFETTIKARATM
jgi:hypothetical protein